MPTQAGWTALLSAAAAAGAGRIFGLVELFVVSAALISALLLAMVTVRVRTPTVVAQRDLHPGVLTVGDAGRVDLTVTNRGRTRTPRALLEEPVGSDASVRLTLAALRAGDRAITSYRIAAERRGLFPLGPLEVRREDLLGLAASRTLIAPLAEVLVAPRTFALQMPQLGQGVLGRHLMTQAQRLGAGEFHGLREYQDGDEPRRIHWRASARSEGLKVRQYTTEGIRRCIVVLDGECPPGDDAADAFERAIVAAASLVESSDRAGLTTRFLAPGGVDLRGPDVAANTLRVAATIEPSGPLEQVDRDPGDGLGLIVVVTHSAATTTWYQTEQLIDPTLSRIGVFTGGIATGAVRLSVDASTNSRFCEGWDALTGHGGLDVRSSIIRHVDASV
jgi:uncharacterized protein (DUF58 family)